jgi:hypothetical protein
MVQQLQEAMSNSFMISVTQLIECFATHSLTVLQSSIMELALVTPLNSNTSLPIYNSRESSAMQTVHFMSAALDTENVLPDVVMDIW